MSTQGKLDHLLETALPTDPGLRVDALRQMLAMEKAARVPTPHILKRLGRWLAFAERELKAHNQRLNPPTPEGE